MTLSVAVNSVTPSARTFTAAYHPEPTKVAAEAAAEVLDSASGAMRSISTNSSSTQPKVQAASGTPHGTAGPPNTIHVVLPPVSTLGSSASCVSRPGKSGSGWRSRLKCVS